MKVGDIITLCANEEEGWEQETAEVLDFRGGNVIVCVLPQYRLGPKDDGLREVTKEQIL